MMAPLDEASPPIAMIIASTRQSDIFRRRR
jgi:hypothetical protein